LDWHGTYRSGRDGDKLLPRTRTLNHKATDCQTLESPL
jgi:hypothetical protein